ncbi:MAG: SOS response-associated peptidase [Chlorobiaceae bacterium]|nr:SOS response-associated peptidase [Chlorobiaceae bacterium]
MCGRFGFFELSWFIEQLRQLELPFVETPGFSYHQRWNITPDEPVVALLGDHDQNGLSIARWGLIPHWSTSIPKIRPINARADSLATKPFFRHMLARRHCIVPASGFYEWKPLPGAKKEPWYIHRKDTRPMALAGLWDTWQPPGPPSPPLVSCTIITTNANHEMKPVHDRMPVILEENEWQSWLDSSNPAALQLLDSADAKVLELWPVSTRVNHPQNDDPHCIERLALSG